MVQMSLHARACGCVRAHTHSHTEWNTQVAAAAGFSRGCQRLQTPFSCWTYGSSLTLWNHCSRRALQSARVNQSWEQFLNQEPPCLVLTPFWRWPRNVIPSPRKDLIKMQKAGQGLPIIPTLDLIPHLVLLCLSLGRGFIFSSAVIILLYAGL